eukprot:GFUD01014135.1.p1 GENE.GFUD01014135.1~~GFUD01014135.1.p1  ORF type:complete len:250 (+),score=59.02 GFUD01014135.1:49-798(+)
MSWEEEKERTLKLSLDERREEYSCGKSFTPLSEIQSWAMEELYNSKLTRDKTGLSKEKKQNIAHKLLLNFEIDLTIDLSQKVSILPGDITKLEVDAIVNAANSSLLGGGGVDGAVHKAAGENLFLENQTLGGCQDGEAKISGGYKLPAKYVISTVGPRGENPTILELAYNNCLNKMVEYGLRTIAFPCMSTGVYGYPQKKACIVALRTVRRWLEENHEKVDRIIFCLFTQEDTKLYTQRMSIMFPCKIV